jgi:hypothetical protein
MATIGGRAGRYVPEFDWRIALAENTFRAIEWLWCWREFSLPVVAVVVAYKTGHPGLALTAGLTTVCFIVLLLITRPTVVAGAVRRCRALPGADPTHRVAAGVSRSGLGEAA